MDTWKHASMKASMKAWSMRKGREICYCDQQKADLDGTSFAYDYRVRLAYVMDFWPSTRAQFSRTTSTMCRVIYPTPSVVKSWRMLVAHDSRKQNSHRLNRPKRT